MLIKVKSDVQGENMQEQKTVLLALLKYCLFSVLFTSPKNTRVGNKKKKKNDMLLKNVLGKKIAWLYKCAGMWLCLDGTINHTQCHV